MRRIIFVWAVLRHGQAQTARRIYTIHVFNPLKIRAEYLNADAV